MSKFIKFKGVLFYPEQQQAVYNKAIRKTIPFTLNRLQKRSRVDTGRMRDSWRVKKYSKGIAITNKAKDSRNRIYPRYHEFGTRHMAAQPMLAPTVPEMTSHLFREIVIGLGGDNPPNIELNPINSRQRGTKKNISKPLPGFPGFPSKF